MKLPILLKTEPKIDFFNNEIISIYIPKEGFNK